MNEREFSVTRQPWMDNKKWAGNRIASGAKMQCWVLWGFALFWNAICLPMLFDLEKLWRKTQHEPLTALVFLFPLIGIGLIAAAVHSTRIWQKFGLTPLVLDPFPGSLGGHVGGTIETKIPFAPELIGEVTLQCVYSYVSGSGKNRSRKESIKWQSEGACHCQQGLQGTVYRFRFNVPEALPESDVSQGSSYHLWRVNISTKLDGPDFSRSYEIPVFKTGQLSVNLQESTEEHSGTVDHAIAGVESIANIQSIPGGLKAYFPALQRPTMGIMTLIFGLIFTGAGIIAGFGGAPIIFPIIFPLVGGLIALFGVYYLAKSLQIEVTAEGVRSRRFLFGYPITTKVLAAHEIAELEIDEGAAMSSGNKTTVYYKLLARGLGGEKLVLAERLTSRAEVTLLKDTFETYLSKLS